MFYIVNSFVRVAAYKGIFFMSIRLTTEEFIEKAKQVHGDKI